MRRWGCMCSECLSKGFTPDARIPMQGCVGCFFRKRWLGAAGMGALMAFLMASFEAELLMSVDLGHGESGGQDPPHPAIIMS